MTDHYDTTWAGGWQATQRIGPLTQTRYRLMLRELPTRLPAGARVLAVGCGNGTFLATLARRHRGAEFYCVEYSRQACSAAPAWLQQRIVAGNIVDLAPELGAEPFDVVVCSEVLEHVPDPVAAVDAIASLLKPGGMAVIAVPGGMCHWSRQDEAAGHLRRFGFVELSILLLRAGLQVEHQYGWGGPFAETYKRMVSSVGPARVISARRSTFSAALAAALRGLFRADDLFCRPGGFQLVARARKPATVHGPAECRTGGRQPSSQSRGLRCSADQDTAHEDERNADPSGDRQPRRKSWRVADGRGRARGTQSDQ